MAHYAYLTEENIVHDVIVGPEENSPAPGFDSWEDYFTAKGKGVCLRTSYNTLGGVHVYGGTAFRKNYAGIGFTYDEERDAFIPPKPYESWILNENTCLWESPVPYPSDSEGIYEWDESSTTWILIQS